MSYLYRNRKDKKSCEVVDSVVTPVDEVEELPQFYCAGDLIPLQSIGLVKICLSDGEEVCIAHGDEIPEDVNGFVIMDPVTKKLKFVPGKPPKEDPIVVPAIQELFLAGDTLPLELVGKVDVCLPDGSSECLGSGDLIPEGVVGSVVYDEVSNKAYFSNAVKDTTVSDQHIIDIATSVSSSLEVVRSDEEILSIVNSVVDQLPPDTTRSDSEIKAIAQACIETLPEDQVRTDAEILLLVDSVVSTLTDDVRSDAEIKAIAEVCFEELAAELLTASEINTLIETAVLGLPADQVRSNEEIKVIALNCFNSQDTLTMSEIEVLIDNAVDAINPGITESEVILLIQNQISQLPADQVRSDAEIKLIAQGCIDSNPDLVRTDAEINALINAIVDQLPADTVRSDAEIKTIAQQCVDANPDLVRTDAEINTLIQAFIDDFPATDTPRTDAEIKAIAQQCIDDNPDLVRTDAEINSLINTVVDQLPPDTTRSDAEIKAIAQQCIDDNPDLVRTDAEINTLIEAYIDTIPDVGTPRTDAEIKAIAQQCIDDSPDLVRTDAEINALINAIVDLLPPDTVRSDAEIKTIAQDCIDLLPADVSLSSSSCSVTNPNTDQASLEISLVMSSGQSIPVSIPASKGYEWLSALMPQIECQTVTDTAATCNVYESLMVDGVEICQLQGYETPLDNCKTFCIHGPEGQAYTGVITFTSTTTAGQWSISTVADNGTAVVTGSGTANSGESIEITLTDFTGEFEVCALDVCADLDPVVNPSAFLPYVHCC